MTSHGHILLAKFIMKSALSRREKMEAPTPFIKALAPEKHPAPTGGEGSNKRSRRSRAFTSLPPSTDPTAMLNTLDQSVMHNPKWTLETNDSIFGGSGKKLVVEEMAARMHTPRDLAEMRGKPDDVCAHELLKHSLAATLYAQGLLESCTKLKGDNEILRADVQPLKEELEKERRARIKVQEDLAAMEAKQAVAIDQAVKYEKEVQRKLFDVLEKNYHREIYNLRKANTNLERALVLDSKATAEKYIQCEDGAVWFSSRCYDQVVAFMKVTQEYVLQEKPLYEALARVTSEEIMEWHERRGEIVGSSAVVPVEPSAATVVPRSGALLKGQETMAIEGAPEEIMYGLYHSFKSLATLVTKHMSVAQVVTWADLYPILQILHLSPNFGNYLHQILTSFIALFQANLCKDMLLYHLTEIRLR